MIKTRLLAAAATAFAVLLYPATAAIAAAGPEIRWAYSEFEGNAGVLLIGVTAPDEVASLHVDVKSPTDEVIASTDEFWLSSGDHQDGIWATSEPFQLDALGYYSVDVTVTDRSGVTTHREDAGTLSYVVISQYDALTVKPATATYDRRTVTVSGVLRGVWPGSGETRRVSGARVHISAYIDSADATTKADGSFSAELPISESGVLLSVNTTGVNLPFHTPVYADIGSVTIKPRATRVTATVSAKKIKWGETVTVTGQASWKTAAGWEPVPNGRVSIMTCDNRDSCSLQDQVEVDAGGNYSGTATPGYSQIVRAIYYAPYIDGWQPDPYVAQSQRDNQVSVLYPAELSDFTAERQDDGRIHFEGHVQFPGTSSPGVIPVHFQYSASGYGDWVTVGEDPQSYWDGTGYEFEGALTDDRSGYWRARYPGQANGFEAATSHKILVN